MGEGWCRFVQLIPSPAAGPFPPGVPFPGNSGYTTTARNGVVAPEDALTDSRCGAARVALLHIQVYPRLSIVLSRCSEPFEASEKWRSAEGLGSMAELRMSSEEDGKDRARTAEGRNFICHGERHSIPSVVPPTSAFPGNPCPREAPPALSFRGRGTLGQPAAPLTSRAFLTRVPN